MTAKEPPEIIDVDDDAETVSCDGGGGAMGHPVVYYAYAPGQDEVVCGYCGRIYRKRKAADAA